MTQGGTSTHILLLPESFILILPIPSIWFPIFLLAPRSYPEYFLLICIHWMDNKYPYDC